MKNTMFRKETLQEKAEPQTNLTPAGETPKKGRIPYIDLIETVAMVFVLAYHLSNCRYKFLEDPGVEQCINYYLRCAFVACVPMFLCANGFLLFRHSFDLKQHLKKTLHYVFLALFWGVVTLLMFNYTTGIPFERQAFLKDLLTWRGGAIHMWYLGAIVIIYLLFPLLKLVYDKDRKLLLYFSAMVAVMSFGNQLINQGVTIVNALQGKWQYWVSRENWFNMFNPVAEIPGYTLVYFCLGAYLQDFVDWLKKFRRRNVNLLAVAGLVVACGAHALLFTALTKAIDKFYCPIWYGYETVTGFLITLCIIVLCANYQGTWKPGAKLLQRVSSNTMGIYLIHMCIIYTFKEKLLTIGPLNNFPMNIVIALVLTVVCLGITMLLRRIPVIRKLVS